MRRYFNTAGPCSADRHYMLPAQTRCRGILDLIDHEQYFVIHAARQSGKTTLLQELVRELNAGDRFIGLYCSLETAEGIREPEKGIPAIVRSLGGAIEFHPVLGGIPFGQASDFGDYNNVLKKSLQRFCAQAAKPLVVLFDEVDCLSNGTIVCFLRQLRDGYVSRSMIPFVHSMALVGMRNIRDYQGRIREDRDSLGSASPFNIVTETLTLRNFTLGEVEALYAQHTGQEGQEFPRQALERAYHYTQGQPWLVNAIAREIVVKILESDFSREIRPEHVDQAVETIIQRRDTHIDSLLRRLKEERVRKVVDPVLAGAPQRFAPLDDDVQYAIDLGLVKREQGALTFSNPLYAEVVSRALGEESEHQMQEAGYPPGASRYVESDTLKMRELLTDFQSFWRENSEIWQERYEYKEAAPHLILMAFLQNVVGDEGRIHREFATGRGRIDLCIELHGHRYPLELKVRQSDKTLDEGRTQLRRYLEALGCQEGWLILFDRRKDVGWDEKILWQDESIDNRTIHIVGC